MSRAKKFYFVSYWVHRGHGWEPQMQVADVHPIVFIHDLAIETEGSGKLYELSSWQEIDAKMYRYFRDHF